MKKIWILLLIGFFTAMQLFAQLEVGDPGVNFGNNDSDWPQMSTWKTAGVRGGIPLEENLNIKKTISATNSAGINSAINSISNGAVKLMNGTYTIDATVQMKSGVSLVGASRTGVILKITKSTGDAILFDGVSNCGIYRMKIEGNWGTPTYKWNIGSDANKELPNNTSTSIRLKNGATDCWVDKVDILNSGLHPLWCNASHNTFRGLYIKGCHNKGSGAQGYFVFLNGYNLITDCYVTQIRHITLQGSSSKYNVLYDNNFEQEVSFHNDDGGNNLIEKNDITLPSDMPPGGPHGGPGYWAIMGHGQHRIMWVEKTIFITITAHKINKMLNIPGQKTAVFIRDRMK